MEPEARQLVESLHSAESVCCMAIAGAGTRAIGWVLGVAGASRTVLDIQVPYAPSAMIEYVGSEPDQFVSESAALALARAAYRRAVRLRGDSTAPAVGLSCSATIATDRTKRGDHRCHVVAYDATGWLSLSLTLTKGLRSRDEEDAVVSALILNAMAQSFGVENRLDARLASGEEVLRGGRRFDDALAALASGHIGRVVIGVDGILSPDAAVSGALLAGSFNPLHRGHTRLAEAAGKTLGAPVTYELSISNVDKPDLKLGEVRRRLAQFQGKASAVVTRVPVFYRKAALFPGATFVIGFDTMTRLIDPKYYDGDAGAMLSALSELRERGCRFLVAGRSDAGAFRTLDDVSPPPGFDAMFTAIPESAFREDVSSTELRKRPDA